MQPLSSASLPLALEREEPEWPSSSTISHWVDGRNSPF